MTTRFNERTAVFIDGPNNYAAIKALGFEADYKRLLGWLRAEFDPVLRVSYYTPYDEDETVHQNIKPLLDYLAYNGYNLITKPVRQYDNDDGRKTKVGVVVDIAVDIMLTMHHVDTIVVFSGDTELRRPLAEAQKNGCRIIVVSTNETVPRVVSDDLRRLADEFIELDGLQKSIARVDKPVPALAAR